MPEETQLQPCKKRLYDFYRIPDGSVAELWVAGEKGAFQSTLRVRTATSHSTLSHDDLYRAEGTTKKARIPLRAPGKYLITLWTHFSKKTTIAIAFRIVKPAGSPGPNHHGSTPLRCTVTADKGTEDDRAFLLFTIQKSNG